MEQDRSDKALALAGDRAEVDNDAAKGEGAAKAKAADAVKARVAGRGAAGGAVQRPTWTPLRDGHPFRNAKPRVPSPNPKPTPDQA